MPDYTVPGMYHHTYFHARLLGSDCSNRVLMILCTGRTLRAGLQQREGLQGAPAAGPAAEPAQGTCCCWRTACSGSRSCQFAFTLTVYLQEHKVLITLGKEDASQVSTALKASTAPVSSQPLHNNRLSFLSHLPVTHCYLTTCCARMPQIAHAVRCSCGPWMACGLERHRSCCAPSRPSRPAPSCRTRRSQRWPCMRPAGRCSRSRWAWRTARSASCVAMQARGTPCSCLWRRMHPKFEDRPLHCTTQLHGHQQKCHCSTACGRAGRDKVQRSLLSVREGPSDEQVTGLAFRGGLAPTAAQAAPCSCTSGCSAAWERERDFADLI